MAFKLHLLFLLRARLLHFVNSLNNYLMTRVSKQPLLLSLAVEHHFNCQQDAHMKTDTSLVVSTGLLSLGLGSKLDSSSHGPKTIFELLYFSLPKYTYLNIVILLQASCITSDIAQCWAGVSTHHCTGDLAAGLVPIPYQVWELDHHTHTSCVTAHNWNYRLRILIASFLTTKITSPPSLIAVF